jgi:hypothetical protein
MGAFALREIRANQRRDQLKANKDVNGYIQVPIVTIGAIVDVYFSLIARIVVESADPAETPKYTG